MEVTGGAARGAGSAPPRGAAGAGPRILAKGAGGGSILPKDGKAISPAA